MKNLKLFLFLCVYCLQYTHLFAQCTEAKDSEMSKYKEKTLNQDAQGCSQCAMLALYFCSAKYCVAIEDKRKVGALISECKQNIKNMGQPYCCPEYLNKTPAWGSMAGSNSAKSTNSSDGSDNNTSNSNSTTEQTDATAKLTGLLIETIAKIDNGNSSSLTNIANNYQQNQAISETAEGIVNLFSRTPEEKAKKEQQRLESEKRMNEEIERQRQLRIENEKNARIEFNTILSKQNTSKIESQTFLVIQVMDNYISNKYNYDASLLIPQWSNWMRSAIANENKFATTVFAGKALGFNTNKFNYSIGMTGDEGIKLLEKIISSEDTFGPYLGLGFTVAKKIIEEKNKKKKIVKKEFITFPITTISNGESAEVAGLLKGDVVLKFNNNYITNLSEEIAKNKIGDKIALTILRNNKEIIKEIIIGKRIEENYKVDAIVILANYYNTKALGNDPEKALYYFTKAAENGSPNAMFTLGQIYRYSIFGNKKNNVKYKFKKNEDFAFEWYLKSVQNLEYKKSTIYTLYKIGTYFEPAAFDELIEMYQKGIGCEKSSEKANQILLLKSNYLQKM